MNTDTLDIGVYWTSKYSGTAMAKGYNTPMFTANVKFFSFADIEKARTLQLKLLKLRYADGGGGTYRGRVVVHVSPWDAQMPASNS